MLVENFLLNLVRGLMLNLNDLDINVNFVPFIFSELKPAVELNANNLSRLIINIIQNLWVKYDG